MASDWKTWTIAECAAPRTYSTQIGPFGKAIMAADYTLSGVPVLRGMNVNRGRFYDDEFVFISEEAASRLAKFEAFPNDVLLVHKGTIGPIGMLPTRKRFSKYIMGNSMMRVSCDVDKVRPLFLYYWLSSDLGQAYLRSRISQVGVPQLQRPLTTLREAVFAAPDIHEQDAITSILDCLDSRIESIQNSNQQLERIAQAIFKSWFVDFDPVRAKADGREPEGMDAATAALFPSNFFDSELGPLPAGWEAIGLGALIELAYGKALKAENRVAGNVPVMGSNGRIGWNDAALVKGPGIVVGRKGNPGIVTWVNSDFFPIDTTFYVKPKEYARGAHILRYQLSVLDLPSLGADSAVPGLNREMAYLTKLPNPPKSIADRFASSVLPMIEKIAHDEQQIQTLSELRDTLLPRLISGKLRVPEAEKLVEAVL